MNGNTSPAIITPVLAAGSTTSPYFIQLNISQRLCAPTCKETTPIFTPSFKVVGISPVGSGQYMVTIHAEGVITFIPCGKGSCCTVSQAISKDFTLPVASATAPTSVTVTAGATINAVHTKGCATCGRDFVSETPLTLTIA